MDDSVQNERENMYERLTIVKNYYVWCLYFKD